MLTLKHSDIISKTGSGQSVLNWANANDEVTVKLLVELEQRYEQLQAEKREQQRRERQHHG